MSSSSGVSLGDVLRPYKKAIRLETEKGDATRSVELYADAAAKAEQLTGSGKECLIVAWLNSCRHGIALQIADAQQTPDSEAAVLYDGVYASVLEGYDTLLRRKAAGTLFRATGTEILFRVSATKYSLPGIPASIYEEASFLGYEVALMNAYNANHVLMQRLRQPNRCPPLADAEVQSLCDIIAGALDLIRQTVSADGRRPALSSSARAAPSPPRFHLIWVFFTTSTKMLPIAAQLCAARASPAALTQHGSALPPAPCCRPVASKRAAIR